MFRQVPTPPKPVVRGRCRTAHCRPTCTPGIGQRLDVPGTVAAVGAGAAVTAVTPVAAGAAVSAAGSAVAAPMAPLPPLAPVPPLPPLPPWPPGPPFPPLAAPWPPSFLGGCDTPSGLRGIGSGPPARTAGDLAVPRSADRVSSVDVTRPVACGGSAPVRRRGPPAISPCRDRAPTCFHRCRARCSRRRDRPSLALQLSMLPFRAGSRHPPASIAAGRVVRVVAIDHRWRFSCRCCHSALGARSQSTPKVLPPFSAAAAAPYGNRHRQVRFEDLGLRGRSPLRRCFRRSRLPQPPLTATDIVRSASKI